MYGDTGPLPPEALTQGHAILDEALGALATAASTAPGNASLRAGASAQTALDWLLREKLRAVPKAVQQAVGYLVSGLESENAAGIEELSPLALVEVEHTAPMGRGLALLLTMAGHGAPWGGLGGARGH